MDATSSLNGSPVLEAALAFFLANNEVGMVSVSLTAIINIIKNILSNPKDMKLRTLQKSNKNILYKITDPPGCRELMSAMGWTSVNDAYVLPQSVPVSTQSPITVTVHWPYFKPIVTGMEAQLEAAEKVINDIPRQTCHLPKDVDMAVPLIGSARFEICVGSVIGRRPTMEDEVVVVGMGPAHNPNEDFFGVFDGHGGREAAIYAAKNLYPKIGRNFALMPNEPLKSITNAFEETNAWMLQQRFGSGSTAAVSFVVDSTLYTANAGDTRVVLGWKDKKAVRLSFDHKPSVAAEKERIERLGGEVTKKFGIARVNGVLGVSRAFGDCKLVPFVSAVPHINILELTDETMFLIIACDGLWDEFSDQEAVDIVFDKAATVQNMGEYLSNMAIMRGSQDNVSVIVVFLNPRSALYEEEEEEEFDEVDSEDENILPSQPIPVFPNDDEDEEDYDDDTTSSLHLPQIQAQMDEEEGRRRNLAPPSPSSSSGVPSTPDSIQRRSPSSISPSSSANNASIGASSSNSVGQGLSSSLGVPPTYSVTSATPSTPSSSGSLKMMLSRTLISSGSPSSVKSPSPAPGSGKLLSSSSPSDFLVQRPSFRVVQDDDDDESESDEDNAAGGLGVGSLNAWVEDDDEE